MPKRKTHFYVEGVPKNWAGCGAMGYSSNAPLFVATEMRLVTCKKCRSGAAQVGPAIHSLQEGKK